MISISIFKSQLSLQLVNLDTEKYSLAVICSVKKIVFCTITHRLAVIAAVMINLPPGRRRVAILRSRLALQSLVQSLQCDCNVSSLSW